jgi:hypothetical protein
MEATGFIHLNVVEEKEAEHVEQTMKELDVRCTKFSANTRQMLVVDGDAIQQLLRTASEYKRKADAADKSKDIQQKNEELAKELATMRSNETDLKEKLKGAQERGDNYKNQLKRKAEEDGERKAKKTQKLREREQAAKALEEQKAKEKAEKKEQEEKALAEQKALEEEKKKKALEEEKKKKALEEEKALAEQKALEEEKKKKALEEKALAKALYEQKCREEAELKARDEAEKKALEEKALEEKKREKAIEEQKAREEEEALEVAEALEMCKSDESEESDEEKRHKESDGSSDSDGFSVNSDIEDEELDEELDDKIQLARSSYNMYLKYQDNQKDEMMYRGEKYDFPDSDLKRMEKFQGLMTDTYSSYKDLPCEDVLKYLPFNALKVQHSII